MLEQLKAFFAEAKSEFKKISWPTQEDIKGSTAVVCVTIAFLMATLAVYDLGIMGVAKLMQRIFSK
jgi:preprotein translocase SecE subunit